MEKETPQTPPLQQPAAERGITMKQMCEHIVKAGILERPDGTKPTAKEIFDYSPRGELYMVFEWYKTACEVLKHHANVQVHPRIKNNNTNRS